MLIYFVSALQIAPYYLAAWEYSDNGNACHQNVVEQRRTRLIFLAHFERSSVKLQSTHARSEYNLLISDTRGEIERKPLFLLLRHLIYDL